MKAECITIAIALSASTVLAQNARAQTPSGQPGESFQTMMLTGCIGGGTNAAPFVLSNPVAVPALTAGSSTMSTPPGSTPTPGAPGVASTMPAPGAGAAGSAGVAGGSGIATPGSSATSTAPASGATSPGGSSISPGASPTAGAASPGGVGAGVSGTAGGTSTGATSTGVPFAGAPSGSYRLSGVDVKPWAGQRVQVVGTLMPSTTPAGSNAPGGANQQEFMVQSVRTIGGSCK